MPRLSRTRVMALAVTALLVNLPASLAEDGPPPAVQPLFGVSGGTDDTLVCSLLYVPALVALFDPAAAPAAINRKSLTIVMYDWTSGVPIISGQLWNHVDMPPTSQIALPFDPLDPAGRESIGASINDAAVLADPDFNLLCDVVADGAVPHHRVAGPTRFDNIVLKRGLVANRSFLTYSYFHQVENDIDLRLGYAYVPDGRTADGKTDPGSCPDIETEVIVVDGNSFTAIEGGTVIFTLASGIGAQHVLGLAHEHQNPQGHPASPIIVAALHTLKGAADPDCTLQPFAESRSRGVTSNLDVWVWRQKVVK